MWTQVVIYYEEQTLSTCSVPPTTPTPAASAQKIRILGEHRPSPHSWVPRPPRRQRNLLGGRASGAVVSRGSLKAGLGAGSPLRGHDPVMM